MDLEQKAIERIRLASDAGFAEGWNQCIDAITGGNSDD